MNFKYAIFDLDGTLLDTQKYWDRIERECLEKYFGIDMFNDDDGEYIPFTGFKDMFIKATQRSGKSCDAKAIYKDIYAAMGDIYKHGKIDTKPHSLEFLKELKKLGIKTALATATPIYMCKPALERLGFLPYLDELLCTDDVGKNKFHPDVFDEALKRIGGNKAEAMVFEDALYAAETLKANGYRYTIIVEACNECWQAELKCGCENYIKSYKELL